MKGLPAGIRAVDASGMNITKNPDPRGPCGGKVPQPDLTSGAAEGIVADNLSGIESALRPTAPTAEEFMTNTLADVRPGCPPWTSTTNTGATQTVTLSKVLVPTLPSSIDQSFVGILEVDQSGQHASAALIVMRADDTLLVLTYFTADPIDPATVASLASTAGTRFASK